MPFGCELGKSTRHKLPILGAGVKDLGRWDRAGFTEWPAFRFCSTRRVSQRESHLSTLARQNLLCIILQFVYRRAFVCSSGPLSGYLQKPMPMNVCAFHSAPKTSGKETKVNHNGVVQSGITDPTPQLNAILPSSKSPSNLRDARVPLATVHR